MSVVVKKTQKTFQSFTDLPAWGTSENPPTEFLLFPFGETQATMFGGQRESVFLSPENGQKIVEEWSRRLNKGHFDYDHAILRDNPEGTPSAGSFKIDLRADGLWVTDIVWTPRMLKYFKDKEIQYTSPYFQTEEGPDGKQYVTALLNVAVTNWPATDQLRPLIALSQKPTNKPTTKALSTKARAQGVIMDPKIQEAIKAILEKVKSDGEAADVAQAVLDIQAALAGAADPNANPAPGMAEAMDIAATAKALTSKTKASEVKGALQAAFDAKTENKDLIKRLNALETESAQSLINTSKMTPAQKTWCQTQLSQPNGFETVKSFIEASAKDAPVGPNVALVQPPEVKAEVQSDDPSKELVSFCQSKGLDAKIYLKNWKILNPKKSWSRELA